MFHGSIPALITPFKNGAVDENALRQMIEWHIGEGSHGLVPCGTTGESPTLNEYEHMRIIEISIETAKKRVPIIAGCGFNDTQKTIETCQKAQKLGADAVLVVAPYYNKPTQEGLFRHYKAVNDALSIPIIVYNIPGRSVVDISIDTMARLAELKNIVGVKDATADLARPLFMRLKTKTDFCQLSGEDATALPFLVQGGVGCISVTANIAPKLCAEMHNAWRAGNIKRAEEINLLLAPLHQALFCETSPAPVKFAAAKLGLCANELRLPMIEASESAQRKVEEAMAGLNLKGYSD